MFLTSNKKGLAPYLRTHVNLSGIIVCEDPKFIYMKPTKTAGTSILRGRLEAKFPDIFHLKDNPDRFNSWIDQITDEELEAYFIFSVVRNPWDRMVSISSYFKIPFDEFVQNLEHHWGEDDNLRIHSLPIHHYTHHKGLPFVDFICRFETIQADMNLVFDHIGLDREPLPFKNRSKHRHYSTYYKNRSTLDTVAEIYKLDIAYYGYAFEALEQDEKNMFSKFAHSLSNLIGK